MSVKVATSGLNIIKRTGLSDKKIGILLLLISSVCFSFAGVFTKGVEASSWDVIYWRALFSIILVVVWYGGRGQLKQQIQLNRSGVFIAFLAVICTSAFITSFKFTSIANVAMIYATVPLIAGILGWFILRERVSRRELIGSIVALAGVAIVVQGSLGQINIYGDSLAMLMTVTLALVIVLFRKFPATPSGGVNILSCGVLVLLCHQIGTPFSVPLHEIFILAWFALFFMVAYITLQEGSKLLSPSLTGLLSLMEAPLAPIWAWLILSEIPIGSTIIGGAVIVLAVLGVTIRLPNQ